MRCGTFCTLTLQLQRRQRLYLTTHKQGTSFFLETRIKETSVLIIMESFGVKFDKLCTLTYKLVHVIGTILLT